MKTKFISLGVFAALLFSCCDDDNDNSTNNQNALSGVYNLTAVTAPVAVDFNQDGIASQNLIGEVQCYADSYIILNGNSTFTSEYSTYLINSEIGCDPQQGEGTWSESDNEVMLTNTLIEPNLETIYSVNGNELIMVLENAPYPDRGEEGNQIYATGNLVLTYTKEE